MKLVSVPYRWLPRTIFKNLNHMYWDIKNGVCNLFTFFEAVWWFRSWDWTGLVSLIRVSAHQMRLSQEFARHTDADKEAKRLLIVEEICKRLLKDAYFEKSGYDNDMWYSLTDHRRSQISKHSEYMSNQDAAYLGKMLRFVQFWWS